MQKLDLPGALSILRSLPPGKFREQKRNYTSVFSYAMQLNCFDVQYSSGLFEKTANLVQKAIGGITWGLRCS